MVKLPDVEGEWEAYCGYGGCSETRTYRKLEPKPTPMTRKEAILWMMADEKNVLEVDEYSNLKMWVRWKGDYFESTYADEPNGWHINSHHLPFLMKDCGFREFRSRSREP